MQHQKPAVNGKPCTKQSTDGWEIFVLRKDEINIWEKLPDLKD